MYRENQNSHNAYGHVKYTVVAHFLSFYFFPSLNDVEAYTFHCTMSFHQFSEIITGEQFSLLLKKYYTLRGATSTISLRVQLRTLHIVETKKS